MFPYPKITVLLIGLTAVNLSAETADAVKSKLDVNINSHSAPINR